MGAQLPQRLKKNFLKLNFFFTHQMIKYPLRQAIALFSQILAHYILMKQNIYSKELITFKMIERNEYPSNNPSAPPIAEIMVKKS